MRLHVRKRNVVIRTSETAGSSLSLLVEFYTQDEAMDVAQPQGLCGLYFYAPLMVPKPTRFPTNSLYAPMDHTPLFNAVRTP